MAVDRPATILIIGAGPIGLETALYARYLGYDVIVCEAGDVCQQVQRWKHVRMFSPFELNYSPLGKAAIESHDPQHSFPNDDEIITARQWMSDYLIPLAQTDLIRKHIQTNCRVISVSRTWVHKSDLDSEQRQEDAFRVLIQREEIQQVITADVVIDTSGVLTNPNPIGAGGSNACGEQQVEQQIDRVIPTIDAAEALTGKRVAVVGAGHSAATTLIALAENAVAVTWITRNASEIAGGEIPDDPLTERKRISQRLTELVLAGKIHCLPNVAIHAITTTDDSAMQIEYFQQTDSEDELEIQQAMFEHVFGFTGYRPDTSMYRELQVHQCYATEGPIKLAANLLNENASDCLEIGSGSNSLLLNPEPDFYILGMKSYGRQPGFLFHTGLQQVVQLFQILGDRESLNVYQTFQN